MAAAAPAVAAAAVGSGAADSKAPAAAAGASSAVAAGAAEKKPLRLFVFGATGRTGIHYVPMALKNGHTVTCFVRNAKGLGAAERKHPQCHVVEGALTDGAAVQKALRESWPDVVVSMLASDPKPHTAMSDATRSLLNALEALNKEVAAAPAAAAAPGGPNAPVIAGARSTGPLRPHYFAITAWGIEESQPLMHWFDRFVLPALMLLYREPIKDFGRQDVLLKSAQAQQVLPPDTHQHFILPPILTSGPPTAPSNYAYGDLKTLHDLRVLSTIARSDMAVAMLKLTEQAAAGVKVPKHITIRNNQRLPPLRVAAPNGAGPTSPSAVQCPAPPLPVQPLVRVGVC